MTAAGSQEIGETILANSTPAILGKAAIVRGFYEQREMGGLWAALQARTQADPEDAAALMDQSIMLQVMGDERQALITQQAALQRARTYRISNGDGTGLKVLAFVAAGNFMANTPIEFLLEHSNAVLLLHYVDETRPGLPELPAHDVAFVAISQYDNTDAALAHLGAPLQKWRRPVMNREVGAIMAMTRDGVSSLFANSRHVHAPMNAAVTRSALRSLCEAQSPVSELLPQHDFPIIIRPHGTHAGKGLEKITARKDLAEYLLKHGAVERFYIAPFVDYQDARGRFRKARVAVIDGKPFASHLAVSANWMVHYLNADMTQHADRREEEARWMAAFDVGFAIRHKPAIQEMHERLNLDYFVVDCAELADGRLLLFEADTGMIVHSMDPADMFAYKVPAMQKIFAAFESSLERRALAAGADVRCSHTGKLAVFQKTHSDALTCALAMFAGRSYEDIEALARSAGAAAPHGSPMADAAMRAVAATCGFTLVSGIAMDWDRPAIIGLHFPPISGRSHAVFWDGQKLIDPGRSTKIDRAYVERFAIEFTQEATVQERLLAVKSPSAFQALAGSMNNH